MSSSDSLFELISKLVKLTPVYASSFDIKNICGHSITSSNYSITGFDLKNIWKYHCSQSKEFNENYTDQYRLLSLLENKSDTVEMLSKKIDTTYTEDEKYITIYEKNILFKQLFDAHITSSTKPHLIIYIINNTDDEINTSKTKNKSKILIQLHADDLWVELYKNASKSENLLEAYQIFNKSPFRIFEGDLEDFNLSVPENLKKEKIIALCYTE
jgi:hypothetical protein